MRFLLLIVLPSCGQIRGGSQIGTENDGCEIVSTEPAPVGVPDGFSLTVADAEGMALGAFAGTLDDSAEALGRAAHVLPLRRVGTWKRKRPRGGQSPHGVSFLPQDWRVG